MVNCNYSTATVYKGSLQYVNLPDIIATRDINHITVDDHDDIFIAQDGSIFVYSKNFTLIDTKTDSDLFNPLKIDFNEKHNCICILDDVVLNFESKGNKINDYTPYFFILWNNTGAFELKKYSYLDYGINPLWVCDISTIEDYCFITLFDGDYGLMLSFNLTAEDVDGTFEDDVLNPMWIDSFYLNDHHGGFYYYIESVTYSQLLDSYYPALWGYNPQDISATFLTDVKEMKAGYYLTRICQDYQNPFCCYIIGTNQSYYLDTIYYIDFWSVLLVQYWIYINESPPYLQGLSVSAIDEKVFINSYECLTVLDAVNDTVNYYSLTDYYFVNDIICDNYYNYTCYITTNYYIPDYKKPHTINEGNDFYLFMLYPAFNQSAPPNPPNPPPNNDDIPPDLPDNESDKNKGNPPVQKTFTDLLNNSMCCFSFLILLAIIGIIYIYYEYSKGKRKRRN